MSPSLSLIFLFAASIAAVSADSENVLVLSESNFEETINGNEFVLVKFYAPWCGHCKSLAPKYDEAADFLKEEGSEIRLAKVDATENQALASKFEVRGYPTILYFKSGKPTKYTGGRATAQIVDWVKKKSGPTVTVVETSEQLENLKSKNRVVVIGYFQDAKSEASTIFNEVADSADDTFFAVAGSAEIASSASLNSDGVALIRTDGDDSETNTIEEAEITNTIALKQWIHGYKLSPVTEFTHDSAQEIVGGDLKKFHFLIIRKSDSAFDDTIAKFTEVAKLFRARVVFVLLNIDVEENGRILEFLGVDAKNTPANRIVSLADQVEKFKPHDGEDYEAFTNSYLEGKATQDLKAQELPEDWNAQPVKVLVASNFHEIALDETKTVFVKFYAPWCGHCKQLVPVWDQLAEKYESNPNVVIAKLDATLNELADIKVNSFPTLKLWPAGSSTPIDYDGDRNLEKFEEFVNKYVGSESASQEHEEL
ncbi:CRE-PDI-1 protein [Caenorhabditis remanei]|uniref:Protein disulfide-isomerase n=1 Tax=Caenorhabditis remanei TaxID=31234 RepID=E3LT72_CAERE|nr:CRE-PDI-1 protein [Caenorhabditis remanei]